MHLTDYVKARMSQRGIRKDMLELVLEHGTPQGDTVVLNAKECRELIATLRAQQKRLEDVARKSGLVVAARGETMITAYRANGFSAAKSLEAKARAVEAMGA